MQGDLDESELAHFKERLAGFAVTPMFSESSLRKSDGSADGWSFAVPKTSDSFTKKERENRLQNAILLAMDAAALGGWKFFAVAAPDDFIFVKDPRATELLKNKAHQAKENEIGQGKKARRLSDDKPDKKKDARFSEALSANPFVV